MMEIKIESLLKLLPGGKTVTGGRVHNRVLDGKTVSRVPGGKTVSGLTGGKTVLRVPGGKTVSGCRVVKLCQG